MRIEYRYNHLHAEEYLYYRKKKLIEEIEDCIGNVDANRYLKVSCDKANLGLIYYDQKALNLEIKNRLSAKGWNEYKTSYYVTSDEQTTKDIVKETDADIQKKKIIDNGFEPLNSHNQVDFMKERVAVEVQFGKYFSVAYDLHVKHTFFFLRDDIEVGIEIIPTHRMMLCMDTGVAWFENEVTNVIREGRNNPSVPIYILGIESDDCISTDPHDYTDLELQDILAHSDVVKLKNQISKVKVEDQDKWTNQIEKAKEKVDIHQKKLDNLNQEYLNFKACGLEDDSKEIIKLIKQSEKIIDQKNKASDKWSEITENPPARLARIWKIESLL